MVTTVEGILLMLIVGSFGFTQRRTEKQATKDDLAPIQAGLMRVESRMDDVYKLVAKPSCKQKNRKMRRK